MDRRRSSRASRSRSLRRWSPERRRRRSRSYSRSPSRSRGRSRSRSIVNRQTQSSWTGNGRRDHNRRDTHRYDHRSVSTSRERRQEWSGREREANSYARSNRRSRSRSPRSFERSGSNRSRDARWDSRRRRSPSPRRRSPAQRQRSVSTRRRSSSWHRYSTSQRHRSPPTPRQRSPSPPQRSIPRSPSPQRRSPSSSPRQWNSGTRQHSSSSRQDNRGRDRDRSWERSRSQSASRRRRTDTVGSPSNESSSGRSSIHSDDKPPPRRTSSDAERTSMVQVSPKLESVETKDTRQQSNPESVKAKVNAYALQSLSDYKGNSSNVLMASHDTTQQSHSNTHTHHHYQDGRATSSSPATHGPATPMKASDRLSTLSPHSASNHGMTASTPPTNSGAYRVTVHVNPVQDKNREARYEAHHAYLKSNSDYNRAEMKYVSLGAELRLAEFWLEIMTKNLEDVGKRIEVHDWNFQKAAGLDESAA